MLAKKLNIWGNQLPTFEILKEKFNSFPFASRLFKSSKYLNYAAFTNHSFVNTLRRKSCQKKLNQYVGIEIETATLQAFPIRNGCTTGKIKSLTSLIFLIES